MRQLTADEALLVEAMMDHCYDSVPKEDHKNFKNRPYNINQAIVHCGLRNPDTVADSLVALGAVHRISGDKSTIQFDSETFDRLVDHYQEDCSVFNFAV